MLLFGKAALGSIAKSCDHVGKSALATNQIRGLGDDEIYSLNDMSLNQSGCISRFGEFSCGKTLDLSRILNKLTVDYSSRFIKLVTFRIIKRKYF